VTALEEALKGADMVFVTARALSPAHALTAAPRVRTTRVWHAAVRPPAAPALCAAQRL